MNEALSWIQAGATPFVAFLAYLVWDLKRNHVAHIEAAVERMREDIAWLKGRGDKRG